MENKQKFLSFNLGVKDTSVISLQHITEVLKISLTEVCSVPQMPNCVLGIYNWRGEMLWLVDLEEMLGYPPLLQDLDSVSKMMAIILESDGKYLGLLVRQLMDIEWLDTNQMKAQSTELFYPAMSPFLQGYFINSTEEIVFNLDAPAIIQASLWGLHN
ncbi:chemotaxis protein CheW [Calothrix sp. PCC 7507]|uniref:chemotaxis protein CheW n=1 Tax=Calothrix sp. PCC 7507 TaxID=99598 RepID=UPI0005A8F56B|nr:chemotaxis protein CheW [Calothrix sp. PCC 7507]